MEDRRRDGRVGQDDRQHRRHPRMDHPDALGDPGHAGRRPARHAGPGRLRAIVACFVRESVVRRATAAASSPASVATRPVATTSARPARTRSSGRRVPITPVDRSRVDSTGTPTASAQRLGDLELVRVAGRPGRRVRAAARRDDRPRPAVAARAGRLARGEVRLRQPDRRRGEPVRGEHRGRRGRSVGRDDDRQVGPPGGLDPGGGRSGGEAGRQRRPSLDRRQVSRAAVRASTSRSAGRRSGRRVMARAGAARARASRAGRGRG